MTRKSRKYCVDRGAIAMMQRDGMGWGHDLDAGCVRLPQARTRNVTRKFYKMLRRGV